MQQGAIYIVHFHTPLANRVFVATDLKDMLNRDIVLMTVHMIGVPRG